MIFSLCVTMGLLLARTDSIILKDIVEIITLIDFMMFHGMVDLSLHKLYQSEI